MPNERLGIPPIHMNDGPQGFRENMWPGTTTAWPSSLTVAASWDPEATGKWGDGMGKEFFAKGANVQLGPGVCLARVPRNGRNFEYLSGEDPFLVRLEGSARWCFRARLQPFSLRFMLCCRATRWSAR